MLNSKHSLPDSEHNFMNAKHSSVNWVPSRTYPISITACPPPITSKFIFSYCYFFSDEIKCHLCLYLSAINQCFFIGFFLLFSHLFFLLQMNNNLKWLLIENWYVALACFFGNIIAATFMQSWKSDTMNVLYKKLNMKIVKVTNNLKSSGAVLGNW